MTLPPNAPLCLVALSLLVSACGGGTDSGTGMATPTAASGIGTLSGGHVLIDGQRPGTIVTGYTSGTEGEATAGYALYVDDATMKVSTVAHYYNPVDPASLPAAGSASFRGETGGVVVTGLREGADGSVEYDRQQFWSSGLTLTADFGAGTLTGGAPSTGSQMNGKALTVDATIAGPNGLTGTVQYGGTSAQLQGEIDPTWLLGGFHSSDGSGAIAGYIRATEDD